MVEKQKHYDRLLACLLTSLPVEKKKKKSYRQEERPQKRHTMLFCVLRRVLETMILELTKNRRREPQWDGAGEGWRRRDPDEVSIKNLLRERKETEGKKKK